MDPLSSFFGGFLPRMLVKQQTVELPVIQQRIGEFEQLQDQYSDLFHNDFIKKADRVFQKADDVHLDKYLCAATQQVHHLGVGTLKKSIALGGIGTSDDGEKILVLGHIRRIEAKEALEVLKRELKLNGCQKSTIKFYAIGGVLKDVHTDDGSSFDLQKDLLSLAKTYNICGVKFNITTSEDVLQIVFDESGMYYSKQTLFTPIEGSKIEQDWF